MKLLLIASRFSFLLLLLIAIEGGITWGEAFKFEKYSSIGWITQASFLIILLRASVFPPLWTKTK